MIDYVNSRIIITIAAIAITGLVLSMSFISADRYSKSLAEEIADQLSDLLSTASKMKCDHFTANFSLNSLPSSIDVNLILRNQSITVLIGDYSAIRILENDIILINGNRGVDLIEFRASTSNLVIHSEKNILEKFNTITVELIDRIR